MSLNEDGQSSEDEFSEQEDEEKEGFPIQLPENMNWARTKFEANIEDYSLQCGPHQESTLRFFQLALDNGLIEQITEFMNKTTVAKQAVDWERTTTAEIKALLAIAISNDLLVVKRDEC